MDREVWWAAPWDHKELETTEKLTYTEQGVETQILSSFQPQIFAFFSMTTYASDGICQAGFAGTALI